MFVMEFNCKNKKVSTVCSHQHLDATPPPQQFSVPLLLKHSLNFLPKRDLNRVSLLCIFTFPLSNFFIY